MTGRLDMSPEAQKMMARADDYHEFAGCQPLPDDCILCNVINRVRTLEEALSDAIALMSGASEVALTDELVLKKARKAYYGGD